MGVSFTDKIENIRKEIMKEAETKRVEIIAKASQWAKEYSETQTLLIENELRKQLEALQKENRNAADKNILQAELELKKSRMKKNSELVEKIFSEVDDEFKLLRMKPNYPELLKTMVIEAVRETVENEIQILFDKRDAVIFSEDFLNSVREFILVESGRKIILHKSEESIETEAGIVIKPEIGNYFITNTVEERFNSAKTELKFLILSELQE